MCTSLILGSLKISLTIFNILHVIVGICIVSFGLYLQVDYGTYVVTVVTLAVGTFITIIGCLGICAVSAKNWCLITTYTIFMGILFFTNVTILVISFADYNTFIGAVGSNNSDIKEVQDDLKRGKHVFEILQCVVVLVEFICVWFSLMFRKNEGEIMNEYEEFPKDKSNDLTLGSNDDQGTPPPFHHEDEKVMTASQKKRHALREKYGIQKKE